jgi:carboxymethylenebutenolidase
MNIQKVFLSFSLLISLLVIGGSIGFAQTSGIPPAEEEAKARLNNSPRHGEWVSIDAGSGDIVDAWLVFPERSDNAPVVIVIHEIYGLTDWVRAVADQLAAEGFIAIAPDFLSGKGTGGKGSSAINRDDARRLIQSLSWNEIVLRLDATAKYAVSPATEKLAAIKAPVLGLYGGDDNRVNSTIPAAEAEMKRLGKQYEYEIYDGAGHAFLRNQAGKDGANLKATQMAWPRMVNFLRETLGS